MTIVTAMQQLWLKPTYKNKQAGHQPPTNFTSSSYIQLKQIKVQNPLDGLCLYDMEKATDILKLISVYSHHVRYMWSKATHPFEWGTFKVSRVKKNANLGCAHFSFPISPSETDHFYMLGERPFTNWRPANQQQPDETLMATFETILAAHQATHHSQHQP